MPRINRKTIARGLALLLLTCRAAYGAEAAEPAPVNPPPATPTGVTSVPASEAAPAPADASDPGAQLFMQKCAGCHTVGGGALTGPDLKAVQSWPRQNVDPAILRMEKNVGKLKPEEVDVLATLLLQPDAASRLADERKRISMKEMASLEPANAAIGAMLFHGDRALVNGGLACAACHAVGGAGGSLAIDLTGSFAKLGQAPLMSTIEGMNFPLMQATYADNPITKQEAVHLVKYLEVAAAQPIAAWGNPPLHAVGAFGAVAGFVGVSLMYRKRNRGVRAKLVREAMRRSRS